MQIGSRVVLFVVAVASALALFRNAAQADQIDGTWCSPTSGKSIVINGRDVITPSGQKVVANYNRHHIDYEIPPGDEHAQHQFSADQLNDEQIRVTIIAPDTKVAGPAEIWTPCKPVS